MSEFADKVRTIGVARGGIRDDRRRPVAEKLVRKATVAGHRAVVLQDERNGGAAAVTVEHKDGRVDAVAIPQGAHMRMRLTGGDDG